MELIDLDHIRLYNPADFEDVPEIALDGTSRQITGDMLNAAPEIKEALLNELDEYLIKWRDLHALTGDEEDLPEDPNFTDEQLLNAINCDPFVQSSVYECITGVSDTMENEGVPNYYPSIFDSDNADTLLGYAATGLREDQLYDDLPAKYAHLDRESLELIYLYPACRKILSKTSSTITAEMVRSLCGL
jgi:hypothetical protein